MPDDPIDPVDATWIPLEKRIVWCSIHQEPMESCDCGREWPIGAAAVALLVIAMLGCLSLIVAAFTVL